MKAEVVLVAGGTGSAKLLRGLASTIPQENLTVIANVGDNIRLHGLYICPDVDTAVYTLAGLLDRRRGWGIRGETFHTLQMLKRYGLPAWFQLGDRDLATHIYRTHLLAEGLTLSQATSRICQALGVKAKVLPATDSPVETYIWTADGQVLHLQEFWVKRGGVDPVAGVEYRGAETASPAPGVIEAIEAADAIVIAPANPVTSIGPILAIPGIKQALHRARSRTVAVSPIAGGKPFSGPAARLMEGLGIEVSALSIARLYRDIAGTIVIDRADQALKDGIERLGLRCAVEDTFMVDVRAERRLARRILRLMGLKPPFKLK